MGKLTNSGKSTPQNTVSLLTSTVKMDDEDGVMRFCFRWGVTPYHPPPQ